MPQYKNFLHQHNEEFIRPNLGYIPANISDTDKLSLQELSILKNAVRSLLAYNRPILFPGRDTWLFYLLARKSKRTDFYYRPEVSRRTVTYWAARYSDEFPDNTIIFDTGWNGTIPNEINEARVWGHKRHNLDSVMFSSANRLIPQLYPNFKAARELAIKIENMPHHLTSAYTSYKHFPVELYKIIQDINKEEFARAAAIDQYVWHTQSPKFFTKG